MRVLPVFSSNRSFVNNGKKVHSKIENSSLASQNLKQAHKYTGVVSADLAYASMFDSAIAKDLKLMGLI